MSRGDLWSAFVRLNTGIYNLFSFLGAFTSGVVVVAVSIQVIARYIFAASTPWSEEISIQAFVWTVMFGTAMGVRDHSHLVADLMPETISPLIDKLIASMAHIVHAILIPVFFWYGLKYAELGLIQMSDTMGYPMYYMYISLPIASFVMGLFLIERVIALWWDIPMATAETYVGTAS